MPYLEANQAELFYLEQGSGPIAAVFGHGTLISSNIWRDFYFPRLPKDWHALCAEKPEWVLQQILEFVDSIQNEDKTI